MGTLMTAEACQRSAKLWVSQAQTSCRLMWCWRGADMKRSAPLRATQLRMVHTTALIMIICMEESLIGNTDK